MDVEEILFNWEVGCPRFQFLCIEGNFWVKEGGFFCQGIDKETLLLDIACPWRSNWIALSKQGCWRYGFSWSYFGQCWVFYLGGEGARLHNEDYGYTSCTQKIHLHQAIPPTLSLHCQWPQQPMSFSPKCWRYPENTSTTSKSICFSSFGVGGECLLVNARLHMKKHQPI